MSMLINATTGIQNATWGNTGRPTATAIPGQQGYNSDTGLLETYNGSSWVAAGGSTFCSPLVVGNSIVANGSAGTTGQLMVSSGACTSPKWMCASAVVGYASPTIQTYASSNTFTVTTPATYTIHVVGAGGSGGSSSVGCLGKASGGGAGGYARKTAFLVAGCYNITIGSGGTSVSGASNGNPGGASSFSGPGLTTITANGGPGGTGGSATCGTATGATGGTATGGDVNVTGGGSGNAISVNRRAATGGGSVGITGIGYSSQNATGSGSCQQSGGASVGSSSAAYAINGGLGLAFPFSGLIGGQFATNFSTYGPGAGSPGGVSGAGIFGGGGGCASGSNGSSGGYGGGGGGGARATSGAGGPGFVIITK